MLDLGIDLNVWPWIWLFIAVVFALVELTILGGSFVLLPFAVSAFVAALLGFYDVSIEVQWGVFVLGGSVLFVGFYRWARRFLADNLLPPGVGADRLVGTIGTVTEEIDPDDPDRRGRIRVEGETWRGITNGSAALRVGSRVRVVSMQGTRVVVEPMADNGPTPGEDHT